LVCPPPPPPPSPQRAVTPHVGPAPPTVHASKRATSRTARPLVPSPASRAPPEGWVPPEGCSRAAPARPRARRAPTWVEGKARTVQRGPGFAAMGFPFWDPLAAPPTPCANLGGPNCRQVRVRGVLQPPRQSTELPDGALRPLGAVGLDSRGGRRAPVGAGWLLSALLPAPTRDVRRRCWCRCDVASARAG
jgi:hypothetical protein